MREVLFRGERTDNGEWIEGDLLQYLAAGKMHIVRRCLGAGGVEVIPETLGQYTGLKDKNGTKIFEGDIVRERDAIHDGAKYIVEFQKGCWIIRAEDDCWVFLYPQDNLEVIGNIHDNCLEELSNGN